jgi:hypothetical protein
MPQETSRPSSSTRIVGAPATRLTYATSVNPSPLTVSLPGSNPTLGSLVVVITNSTGGDVQVQNITFYVPVGGSSTTLTPSSAGIQTAVSDPVHWVFSGPSSPVNSGTADYVLGPATGTSVTPFEGSRLPQISNCVNIASGGSLSALQGLWIWTENAAVTAASDGLLVDCSRFSDQRRSSGAGAIESAEPFHSGFAN